MTNEDKERIEKAAFNYVPHKNDHYADELVEGYIAGATKERELISEQLKQERNKAIDVQKILTNSEGSNHLKWIYDRMIYVLGENPNMDYMHKFQSIIEKLTAHGEH